MSPEGHKKLGEQLLEEGLITRDQLDEALEEQERVDERLGNILIEKGLITEEELVEFISRQTGYMVVSLENYPIQSEVLNFLSREQADRYKAVPIFRDDEVLTVAMQDPLDLVTIDDLEMITNFEVEPAIAPPSDIQQFIDEAYERTSEEGQVRKPVYLVKPSGGERTTIQLEETPEQSPAVKMVNRIVREALQQEATNIHIEPLPNKVQVLFRVYGEIKHFTDLPMNMGDHLISRFEVLSSQSSGSDSEADEILRLRYSGDDITMRLNRIGTNHGDKMVIGVRRESLYEKDLSTLGFDERSEQRLESLLEAPRGLILLTGPEDSGKKTTLYTALNHLSNRQANIITVEDPVDFELSFCSQIQVPHRNPKKKAEGIYNALQADPDILMVNELGNPIVAEASLEAVSTGRKVLSTYYADNSVDALYHLTHKEGIDRYLLANSMIGVVAQRRIRVPKEEFLREYDPSPDLLERLGLDEDETYYRVDPEPHRKNKYRGTTGLYQVLPVNEDLRRCMLEGRNHSAFETAAEDVELETLREKGVRKIQEGVTTIDEVLRVTFREDLTENLTELTG